MKVATKRAVIAALEHAAMSIHHPCCSFNRKNYNCQCHVAKAELAIALLKKEGAL